MKLLIMNHGVFLISKSLLLDVLTVTVMKLLKNYKNKILLMDKVGKMPNLNLIML